MRQLQSVRTGGFSALAKAGKSPSIKIKLRGKSKNKYQLSMVKSAFTSGGDQKLGTGRQPVKTRDSSEPEPTPTRLDTAAVIATLENCPVLRHFALQSCVAV